MRLPDDQKKLIEASKNIIEDCRSSLGTRAAAYRQYSQWLEAGDITGNLALANMLYAHVDKLQSHLFSPTRLRFTVGFDEQYDASILAQAEVAARAVSRMWERRAIDLTFGKGVGEALTFGSCIQKLLVSGGEKPQVRSRLVLPWSFGVYNEGINELDDQEACCETTMLNKHEVWRRIQHLPDADNLFLRVIGHASSYADSQPTGFMHQVLSTAILDSSLENNAQQIPGGIVSLSTDVSMGNLPAQPTIPLFPMHELWVKDDNLNDYVTIQIIEPDILIAPLFKYSNLFCKRHLPYQLIQPNTIEGYFWGRSELVDLLRLQAMLSTNLEDIKRVLGTQFDKLLAFPGFDGVTDEVYAQFRNQGYIGMPPGADVKDLTPQLPEISLKWIDITLQLMDRVTGFDNILSGRGDSGVRSGDQTSTLMRTASPRLRDRALIVERQCANLGDKTLAVLEAKDGRVYYPDDQRDDTTAFTLAQLPDDRRVAVDSHSSSPIYEEDHQQLVAFGLKTGMIDKESAIELLNLPNRDILIQRLKAAQAQQAAFIQQHPEAITGGAKK